jgi:hypothetical protein
MRITRRLLLEFDEMRSQGGMIFEEDDKVTIYVPIVFNKAIQQIQKKYDIEPLLNFTICSMYPFRPPLVKYFDKHIQNIYRISLYKEFDELVKTSNSCILCNKNDCNRCYCLCCSTLVCKNNWVPLKNLSDIINECKKYINIKCRLVERIHCKKVQTRYIPEIPVKYLPIHNYL